MASTLDEEGGLIYGLEYQCRALCAVEADTENVRFLVGTQSLKSANQVHHLVLDEETRSLRKTVFAHTAGEVWDVAASPTDAAMLVTRHASLDASGSHCRQEATLWSLVKDDVDQLDGSVGAKEMTRLCGLKSQHGSVDKDAPPADVQHVSFAPGQGHRLMVLAGASMLPQDIGQGGEPRVVASGGLGDKTPHLQWATGAWNPHQGCQSFAAVAAGDHVVRGFDLRTLGSDGNAPTWLLDIPGHPSVRAVDFNPNKQYHVATAGDDGHARFWDLRSPATPLAVRSDHSHWIWSVRFNQFHDQLVLTTSSDSKVALSCLASISSEPHGHIVDEEDDEEPGETKATKSSSVEDGLVRLYEDHEESVYSCAWSSADPWTFATLSYDGRLVVNQVPRQVKFKILNLL